MDLGVVIELEVGLKLATEPTNRIHIRDETMANGTRKRLTTTIDPETHTAPDTQQKDT